MSNPFRRHKVPAAPQRTAEQEARFLADLRAAHSLDRWNRPTTTTTTTV